MADSSLFDEILKCIKRSAEQGSYIALADETYEELNTDFPPEPVHLEKAFEEGTVQPVQAVAYEQQRTHQSRQQQTPVNTGQPKSQPIIPAAIDLSSLTAETLQKICEQGNPLYSSPSFTLSGFGNVHSKLMFIGESRGRDDNSLDNEISTLLSNMIKAMKFDFNSVYIADTFFHPPLDGSGQNDQEVSVCASYLNRQIQIVKPEVIVFFGPIPLRMLLNRRGVSTNRSQWLDYNGIPVMQTFHPAVILRNKDRKRDVWNDLQLVMKHFKLIN